jgi:small-conductance mechanosensitive channel
MTLKYTKGAKYSKNQMDRIEWQLDQIRIATMTVAAFILLSAIVGIAVAAAAAGSG